MMLTVDLVQWLSGCLLLSLLLAGPGQAAAPADSAERFGRLAEEFLKEYLALSPITATAVGYHEHFDPLRRQWVRLDEQLDDVSDTGIERRRAFFESFRRRLRHEVRVGTLDPQTRADSELIREIIELGLLELNSIEPHKHQPQRAVEALGRALFVPLAVEYAPKEKRLEHLLARLEQVPSFLQAAREQLVDTAPVFLETALEENRGNHTLIRDLLRAQLPAEGPLVDRYQRGAPAALEALEEFDRWLDTELRQRATRSWRLGDLHYRPKLRYALGTDLTPDQILRDAERELRRVRGEMLRRAAPLHAEWFSDHGDHGTLGEEARENSIIREVLERISLEHAERGGLLDEARQNLKDLMAFLEEKQLVTLTGQENLQVIETPPFLRGLYSVAGFWSAPPLQPELGAFYMVTPIPDSWSEEQAASKLREYNRFSMELLSIHEALPGHYLQLQHANRIEPKWRRLLRSVLGNTPNLEGWAVYVQDLMVEEGYRDGDPRLALVNYKWLLRVLANAILDVRMHTGEMTDEQALSLLIDRTFQEKAEAEGKLRRAKLSSTQLPSYFLGWREWWRLRRDLERRERKNFSLREFHDRALAAGAVNLRSLRRLLLE